MRLAKRGPGNFETSESIDVEVVSDGDYLLWMSCDAVEEWAGAEGGCVSESGDIGLAGDIGLNELEGGKIG